MDPASRELLFDALVFLAAGVAHTSFMLGVGVDPIPSLVVGILLVAVGAIAVVPEAVRVRAAVVGLLGVGLAGGVAPRYAARAVRPGETLPLALLLAGVVLVLTFAVLRVSAFDPAARHPA